MGGVVVVLTDTVFDLVVCWSMRLRWFEVVWSLMLGRVELVGEIEMLFEQIGKVLGRCVHLVLLHVDNGSKCGDLPHGISGWSFGGSPHTHSFFCGINSEACLLDPNREQDIQDERYCPEKTRQTGLGDR